MEFDAFDGGIIPGGLRSTVQIRLLICYLLKNSPVHVSRDVLFASMTESMLANYFEISDAFDKLVESGHVLKDKDSDLYYLSESGELIVRHLDTDLPICVRERALVALLRLLEMERSRKENTVEIKRNDRGYTVCFKIPGEGIDLMEMKLYVPEHSQAELVRENFHRNTSLVYGAIIAAITGSGDMLESILKEIQSKGFLK